MSTKDHQNPPLSDPDDASLPKRDADNDESDAPPDLSSEVAKRVRLLGKLIIPPSRP